MKSFESAILEEENISVIGAAGKMGSGIALLLLQEMAFKESFATGTLGKGTKRLKLIDSSYQGLERLREYLRSHMQKYAEKNIIQLRAHFASNDSLVSNKDIIDYFVFGAMNFAYLSTSINDAKETTLCFEATYEDVDAKAALFKALDLLSVNPPIYFTNTSAIPIWVLNEKANLNGRILGFHFYNPPAVQKLLEIIPLENGHKELTQKAFAIAKLLDKTVVFSKDVAGFIGNGYLLREVVASCHLVKSLMPKNSLEDAVFMVDRASCEFLLRPMGIFELIEYIGFELVLHIGFIMNRYLQEPLFDADFPKFLSQCRPFITRQDEAKALKLLGPLPPGYIPWKVLIKDKDKEEKILSYLKHLQVEQTPGARLANKLFKETREICKKLVEDQIASSLFDVECVLKNGFYHLYGA